MALATHGLSKTRIYNIWAKMKARCLNTFDKDYPKYGARGISICDEWIDFVKFNEWAIQNGYRDNLTIERVNNNMGYNKHNCEWKTIAAQNNNKTTSVLNRFSLDFLSELCEYHSVSDINMGQLSDMTGLAKTTVFRIIHNQINLKG